MIKKECSDDYWLSSGLIKNGIKGNKKNYTISVKKLCSRHKTKDSKLVKSANCDLCKLENTINDVLDMPQFRDLRP